MRILWLKSDFLLPLDKGGKLRTWHLMRHLATRHDITFVSFANPAEAHAHGDEMRHVASAVETIPRVDARKGTARFYGRVARHVVSPLPFAVAQYRSRAYRRRVQTLLASGRFDLVVADFLTSSVNLPRRLPCPAVLFTHNVESEIWRRHADTASGPVRRRLYAAQYRRMLRYEGRALGRFDRVLAVSDADCETFARLYPGVSPDAIDVIPTGVDTDYFAPAASEPASASLVFTGSMDWLPNDDAMRWFCGEVLPLVRSEVADVRLSIVGRAPTAAVWKLAASPGVHVTGGVEDVRPYIRDAALFIVPLRIGGGTRLKIFEAMAMARAVVSTTVGAEGLPVANGRHLLLADDPREFAQSILTLLRDPARRNALAQAGRTLVAEQFDWSSVARALEAALVRVVSTSGKRTHVTSGVDYAAGARTAAPSGRLV